MKLEGIKESNRKEIRHFLDIYAPVFISAILTVAFRDIVMPIVEGETKDANILFFEKIFYTQIGQISCIIVLFVIMAFLVFFVCKLFHSINDRKDKKGTPNKRQQIAKSFYKIIIPEIITAVGLFEKAYEIEISCNNSESEQEEIDAEDIFLECLDNGKSISNKAVLYYYEAFYHFKLVAEEFEKDQILEYKNTEREKLKQLYEIIGLDAIKKAVSICRHCVIEICKRIECVEEDKIRRLFDDYNRKLL